MRNEERIGTHDARSDELCLTNVETYALGFVIASIIRSKSSGL